MIPIEFGFEKWEYYKNRDHPNIAEPLSGPEMDNSEDREGYSLACGFGLGLVLLAFWEWVTRPDHQI